MKKPTSQVRLIKGPPIARLLQEKKIELVSINQEQWWQKKTSRENETSIVDYNKRKQALNFTLSNNDYNYYTHSNFTIERKKQRNELAKP